MKGNSFLSRNLLEVLLDFRKPPQILKGELSLYVEGTFTQLAPVQVIAHPPLLNKTEGASHMKMHQVSIGASSWYFLGELATKWKKG